MLKSLGKEFVPDEFKPIQKIIYPEGNTLPFERFFEKEFDLREPGTNRIYLPVHWTAYYVNNGYGQNQTAIDTLQRFIDELPKHKYFTIVQYDDGILNDVSNLDLVVYASGSNKPGYYPIPLISMPLCVDDYHIFIKDIRFSFCGMNTHRLRGKMVKKLNNPHVTFDQLPINEYYLL